MAADGLFCLVNPDGHVDKFMGRTLLHWRIIQCNGKDGAGVRDAIRTGADLVLQARYDSEAARRHKEKREECGAEAAKDEVVEEESAKEAGEQQVVEEESARDAGEQQGGAADKFRENWRVKPLFRNWVLRSCCGEFRKEAGMEQHIHGMDKDVCSSSLRFP